MNYLCETAKINWDDASPHSETFDDIYWQRGVAGAEGAKGAVHEKQFVFIDPLQQLAADLPARSQITVTELGFGFGINCLLATEFWRRSFGGDTSRRLNLVSIEKHPVSHGELAAHLARYDFNCADALLTQYPPPYRGQHVLWLAENVRLLLILDDVSPALTNLDASVDLWLLDGFSPAKNPDMWNDDLFRKMFARSRPGARVATYSAAGHVRRGLGDNGFSVQRVTGFAHKKEMLRAESPGTWQAQAHGRESVSIIGAGLAGLYAAEALAKRGVEYHLIDREQAGASAIPQLAMFPQLAAAAEARYRFSLGASQYMLGAPGYHNSGLVWRGRSDEEADRLRRVASLFPDELIEQVDDETVLFHRAGWLSHTLLADHLAAPGLTADIDHIHYDGQWHCAAEGRSIVSSEHLILATGFNRSLLPDQLQVRAIRGQAISVETRDISQVLNGQVTVFPTVNGRSVVSGTYARNDDLSVSEEDSSDLFNAASKIVDLQSDEIIPHVGIRAVSRDRLPIIGRMPEWSALEGINRVSAVTEFTPGLHLCTAFGSRGAAHARLCAEQVVSQILGEPTALDREMQQMLSPARFVIRDNNAASLQKPGR